VSLGRGGLSGRSQIKKSGFIKKMSDGRKEKLGEFDAVRVAVFGRDGYCCVVCHKSAVHVHHVLPRSSGGSDDFDNLVSVCNSCHRRIHDDPVWSVSAGWLK
jgi:formate-dependent nitrite reductase cytochrome c552 subunit